MRQLPILAAAFMAPLPVMAHPGHGGPEEIMAAVLLIAVAAIAAFVVPKAIRRRRDD